MLLRRFAVRGRMRAFSILCVGIALFACLEWPATVSHAEIPASVAERRLVVRLLDAEGAPAAGVDIALVGLDRINMLSLSEARSLPNFWRRTDAAGHAEFLFERRREGVRGATDPATRPGFGKFRIVALPRAGDAGAISVPVYNWEPPLGSIDPGGIEMTSETLLTLQISKGLTLDGQLLDVQLRPLAAHPLKVLSDVRFESHTGLGGEIFEQEAKTDEEGRFLFEHVNAADWRLESVRVLYSRRWDEQKARWGAWETKADAAGKVQYIIATGRDYVVEGMVLDEAGLPIAGAEVLCLFTHLEKSDFIPNRMAAKAATDEQGRFRLNGDAPYFVYVSASAPGYDTMQYGGSAGAAPLAAGVYAFRLAKQGEASKSD